MLPQRHREFHEKGDRDGIPSLRDRRRSGGETDEGLPARIRQLHFAEIVCFEIAVTGEAIETMELKMEHEIGNSEKTFEPVGAHLHDVKKMHVVSDNGGDRLDISSGKPEALQNGHGDFFTTAGMSIEMDPGCVLRPGFPVFRYHGGVCSRKDAYRNENPELPKMKRACAWYVPKHPLPGEMPGAAGHPEGHRLLGG